MIDNRLRTRVHGAVVKEIRAIFQGAGFAEVVSTELQPIKTNPFIEQFEVKSSVYSGYLAQRSQLALILGAREFEKAYVLEKVFRGDSPSVRNRLLQFHYVQGVMPGDLASALEFHKEMIIRILIAGRVAAGDLNAQPSVTQKAYRVACSDIGKTDTVDLELEDQLKIVANCNSDLVYLTNKPVVLEPMQFDTRSTPEPQNFEVLAPFAGEIGSGMSIEINSAAFLSMFRSSAYRKALVYMGHPDVDTAIGPYADSLGGLSGSYVSVGFSLERVLQTILRVSDINEAVFLPSDAVGTLSSAH